MKTPQPWLGRTIRELALLTTYEANVIAMRQGESLQIPPDIDVRLDEDTALVILAHYRSIEKIKAL